VIETIAASRCPRCEMVVAPPASYCPHHPVLMTPVSLPGLGEIVSFTTLHNAPAGFKSPLHIAIVELDGGARFVCHGADVKGLRVGVGVAIEAIDNIYYFSSLGTLDRARLFWRRAGRAGDRVNAIARSLAKRMWRSRAVDKSA
jgi:acyl-CoA-associated DUF35 OB-fold domain-containing protein